LRNFYFNIKLLFLKSWSWYGISVVRLCRALLAKAQSLKKAFGTFEPESLNERKRGKRGGVGSNSLSF